MVGRAWKSPTRGGERYRDLFLGQAVTCAHLRPKIMLHRRSRQAVMRLELGVIKLVTEPAIAKRIMTHPGMNSDSGLETIDLDTKELLRTGCCISPIVYDPSSLVG